MSDLDCVLAQLFGDGDQRDTDAEELSELAEELFAEADRLIKTLQRPENREILRFAVSWSELQRQIELLRRTVHARLRKTGGELEDRSDPLAVFFQ